MILKTGTYQAAKESVVPQHLQKSGQEAVQGLDFSPFFVSIDKRRISSGKAAAFVNRQEARVVNRMLSNMASSVSQVDAYLAKVAHFQKIGEKPALFHHSRREYQSDLAYMKRQIKQTFENGFSEYMGYQEYYGFGDAFSEGYEPKDVKDLRPKDIRIALNPLAMKLKNFILAIEANLDPISVKDKESAKNSAANISQLHALMGQVNYEIGHSKNQVSSLLLDYGERIDSALEQIDRLDEMADLAKSSADSLLMNRALASSSLPHELKDISLEKVEELLSK